MVCVGLCWARVGTILGLSWAILGYVGTFWATLAPYWAILRYFLICVGLCFGLGHFSVVEFSSMQGVCTKHPKYQQKIQFVDSVADGFCCFFFVSFLGHAAVRLCLPDLGLMLGHFGLCRHVSAPYWAHVGPFCCILWFAYAFVEPF